jgi:hypothetical protein
MESLPFSFRVPGVDALTLQAIGSTRFHFRGVLHLDQDAVRLEWTGEAKVDEVAFTGIRSERFALPLESLRVPCADLRTVHLRGGWFRPYLELTATHLEALRIVPGEEAGRLRLWLARRDRPLARQVVAAIHHHWGRLRSLASPDTPISTPQSGEV